VPMSMTSTVKSRVLLELSPETVWRKKPDTNQK
jgi:hypothetical protein